MKIKLLEVSRDGGNTEDDKARIGKIFSVYLAVVGRRAILPYLKEEGRTLMTSEVEDVELFDGLLRIRTRNAEYEFQILSV